MLKFMVIDDNPEMLELAGIMLRKQGFDFVGVTNGIEAEILALIEHPDIVLLDILMPIQDGWTTLVNLRRSNFSGKIYMFSALSRADHLDKALKLGANGLIQKPITTGFLKDLFPDTP